jgi:hypothetical protein
MVEKTKGTMPHGHRYVSSYQALLMLRERMEVALRTPLSVEPPRWLLEVGEKTLLMLS